MDWCESAVDPPVLLHREWLAEEAATLVEETEARPPPPPTPAKPSPPPDPALPGPPPPPLSEARKAIARHALKEDAEKYPRINAAIHRHANMELYSVIKKVMSIYA